MHGSFKVSWKVLATNVNMNGSVQDLYTTAALLVLQVVMLLNSLDGHKLSSQNRIWFFKHI